MQSPGFADEKSGEWARMGCSEIRVRLKAGDGGMRFVGNKVYKYRQLLQ